MKTTLNVKKLAKRINEMPKEKINIVPTIPVYEEVFGKIKKLQIIIDGINKYAQEITYRKNSNLNFYIKEKDCPLEMIDEHYRLSRILAGIGTFEWNCPFCNKKYSE